MKIYRLKDFNLEKGSIALELCREEEKPEIEVVYDCENCRKHVDDVSNTNWWSSLKDGVIIFNHEHDDDWYLLELKE